MWQAKQPFPLRCNRQLLIFSLISLTSLLFLLSSCSSASSTNGNAAPSSSETELPLYAYRDTASNPWRESLPYCSKNNCNIGRLPFIGQEKENPTIEDIMNRVLVSHSWMGDRFLAILNELDEPARKIILNLFRSVTYIVISGDVRPSYYISSRSAIYLDPLGIALTAAEKATVDAAPDFRSAFGKQLQFIFAWRYVTTENQYLYAVAEDQRQLSHVTYSMGRLLFHELAHANDFYPYSEISRLDCAAATKPCANFPVQLLVATSPNSITSPASAGFGYKIVTGSSSSSSGPPPADPCLSEAQVSGAFHLLCPKLYNFAIVQYFGVPSNDEQKAWRAENIAQWFGNDAALHTYAYTNQYEDVAMLTEVALVKYLWNADVDTAFINHPATGEVNSNTPIAWGRRGLLAQPAYKRRAQEFLQRILPGGVPASFFENLTEAPGEFSPACGWIDNLDLTCNPPVNPALGEASAYSGRSAAATPFGVGDSGDNHDEAIDLLARDSLGPHGQQ